MVAGVAVGELRGQEPAASSLSQPEQALLEVLDERLVEHSIEIGTSLDEWRAEIEKGVKAAKDAAANDPPGAEPAAAVPDSPELTAAVLKAAAGLKALAAGHPELARRLRYEARVGAVLKKADAAAKAEKFQQALTPDLTEEEFREQAKQKALGLASAELRKTFEESIFVQLDELRNASRYASAFLDQKFGEWVKSPAALGDDESFKVRILRPPPGTAILSPKARLGVEIEYLPRDLVLQAEGLHFEYVEGVPFPRPVLDDLKMKGNFKQTVLNAVKALGDELPAELKLPIKVTLKDAPAFASVDGRRGGIRCDVEVGLLENRAVKVVARDLVLYPGNKVDWKGASLKTDAPLAAPIPIGTTPLGLWSVAGALDPASKSVELRTTISTLATRPEVVAFAVTARTSLPVKSLELDGSLQIARQSLAKTVGTLDLGKGTIDGTFTAGDGSLLSQFAMTEGKFSLKRERFIADGTMTLCGQDVPGMHCEISLKDGSARLSANRGLPLFGADFGSTFGGTVGAGFKSLKAEMAQSLKVRISPYGDLRVSVSVSVDTRNAEKPVRVVVKTFDPSLDVSVELSDFGECTREKLEQWIADKGVAAYHGLLKSLAEGDDLSRKLAAKLDRKTRKSAAMNLGGDWQTGVPDLDALGQQLAETWKDAAGAWHDLTNQVEVPTEVPTGLNQILSEADPGDWFP